MGDASNQGIRKVDALTGTISTVAGNRTAGFSGDGGPATSAELNFEITSGVFVDSSGNIFIADTTNNAFGKSTALQELLALSRELDSQDSRATAGRPLVLGSPVRPVSQVIARAIYSSRIQGTSVFAGLRVWWP